MDDIVFLLRKDKYVLNSKDLKLLERAIHYLRLAKQGYKFFAEQNYPKKNTSEVLDAFYNIVYALVIDFNKPDLKATEFLTELKIFEDEIQVIMKEKIIKKENVQNSLKLFKSIEEQLLRKYDEVEIG